MGMRSEEKIDPETSARVIAHLRRILSRTPGGVYEVAERLGRSPSFIYRLLDGGRHVTLVLVVGIHRVFHVEADVLLDQDPPKEFFVPGSEKHRGIEKRR